MDETTDGDDTQGHPQAETIGVGYPGDAGHSGQEVDLIEPSAGEFVGDRGHDSDDGGVRDSIGDAEIDAAIQALNGLDDRPVQEHADALERAHHVLQERLAEGQE